jgi:glycosyltransferase involved in cell wall biosynthesis
MNKKQTAVIAILDNVIPHEKRPGDSLLTRYFLSACQGFVTMSSTVTRDLKPYLGNKPVHQQPHPIYDHFGETLEKAEAKRLLNLDPQFHYLLFFGFIRKYKGLDLAIEAMADERIKKLPVKLLVAGEFYEEATPYHELIKKYNLSDRIVFHSHFIAEGEVKKYFSAADLVIQPYRSATQSGVTQVAFHFNRPVIVTQVGSLPEMVKDGMNGFCTHPSPDAVASAIARFFELDAEARFTAFINEDKKHLGWQTFAEALWKLAQHLLTRGLVN